MHRQYCSLCIGQQTQSVVKTLVVSRSWGCCRSFRRAAEAGQELEVDVVKQLLCVLSAGDPLLLADHCVEAPKELSCSDTDCCLHVWSRSPELCFHSLCCCGATLLVTVV